LDGGSGDFSGRDVSRAGDLNGDGFGDLLIAASMPNGDGDMSASSYVVFGRSSFSTSPVIDLTSLNATSWFRLNGTTLGDTQAGSVSAAGDINGDGFAD